ncbi:MAG: KpsF/GutQ family sugar-phosphate isomerase [Veillonellaceae bacterium]|nr:KpsF/GutQ family sugar-phosphate isomerase [Veillonellaceae bacterium]
MSVLTTMQSVLRTEAEGISALAERLDASVEQAVAMIHAAPGRAVLTGMGKSGHIARKISATMASTGTPSFFLHPAEGIHGDLGMVTEQDVVLAFSNSGETGEIVAILPSLRRIGAKIIAVVGNTDSTLAHNADLVLDVTVEKEACPLGLAPTTSTTVALALGDALAVALMEHARFTADRFAIFHPGGALGRRLLLTVGDVMHGAEDNPVIMADRPVADALFVMTEKGLGAANVVAADGTLKGLVTDGDIRRGLKRGEGFLRLPVGEMMTENPQVITAERLAAEALRLMQEHEPRPVTVLPVVDEAGRAVGMLHITDLLRRGVV